MSERKVNTDALETLGMIHWKPEHRDAIHLAVEPVEAGMYLRPGEHIGIAEGKAYAAGMSDTKNGRIKLLGIVDPFLPSMVEPGDKFWLVILPRMVTSLRHVWEHPDFPEGT